MRSPTTDKNALPPIQPAPDWDREPLVRRRVFALHVVRRGDEFIQTAFSAVGLFVPGAPTAEQRGCAA